MLIFYYSIRLITIFNTILKLDKYVNMFLIGFLNNLGIIAVMILLYPYHTYITIANQARCEDLGSRSNCPSGGDPLIIPVKTVDLPTVP